jgi:thioredoxin 1
MTTEISSIEQFDNLIKNNVTLVDFYADWCGPCKMLSPIIETFSNTTNINVVKINVDNFQTLAARYGIRAIPTLIWFKNGEVVNKQNGSCSLDTLKKVTDQITDSVA